MCAGSAVVAYRRAVRETVGSRRLSASTLARLIACVSVTGALVAWVLIPHRWEGPVVLTITDSHGVHQGDLYGVALGAVVVALVLVVGRRR